MSQFVVLSHEKHRQLKLKKNAGIAYAATQQALPIEAIEVTKAAINFPVFFTKNHHDEMTLSMIAGLSSGTSLFAKKDLWDAAYIPSCLKTYPFYLIRSPEDENQYVVGIQEDNPSFSEFEGNELFTSDGQSSPHLEYVNQILSNHISDVRATVKMTDTLKSMDLFTQIEVVLEYQDRSARKINGIYTIDEQKLSDLSGEQLESLNRDGFLIVMNALLISVHQINNLVRLHNQSDAPDKIVNVKVELPERAS